MLLVLEDTNEPPLSINAKKVPVTLHLTSQWHFYDVRVSKNCILRSFADIRPICQIFAKVLWECDFDGLIYYFWLWKKMNVITYMYAGNFKYIAAILLNYEQKQYRQVATTPYS